MMAYIVDHEITKQITSQVLLSPWGEQCCMLNYLIDVQLQSQPMDVPVFIEDFAESTISIIYFEKWLLPKN